MRSACVRSAAIVGNTSRASHQWKNRVVSSSTIRSTWRGPRTHGEREHRIRLYTATRLAELCAAAGLIVEQAFDGWRDRPLRRTSSEMLLMARKESATRPLRRLPPRSRSR